MRAKSLLFFLEKHHLALFLALLALGSARIVSTYKVFSHTFDEPAHIAAGMEWLAKGVYRWEPQHPPLARVAAALGPFLAGSGSQGTPKADEFSIFKEGLAILYRGNRYERTLTLARLGILPFFWAACATVYLWGRRYFGPAEAVVAVFLFSFLPPVLAHSGLATTDMACTAMLGAAFLAACVFVEGPSPPNAAAFGLLGGLAILSKFSAPMFFAACAVTARVWYLAVERPRARQTAAASRALLPMLALSASIAAVTVWAGYRFSLVHGVPAPELWAGIREVWRHNAGGDNGYILGRLSDNGCWYFFPVALAVKTPIPFLLLAGAGIVLAVRNSRYRRAWLPVTYSAAILAVALGSRINLGLRHILPMYVGLSLLGALAVVRAWSAPQRARWAGVAVSAALLWMAASSLLNHPDYLAYFNEFAARQPERFLVDSDLDWGQDVKRLGLRLQAAGARQVTFLPFAYADFERQPAFEGIAVNSNMPVAAPAAGWNAVSVTMWKKSWRYSTEFNPRLQFWANRFPARERVGESILLWYFPPSAGDPSR